MFLALSPKLLGFVAAGTTVPFIGGVIYVAWPDENYTILLVSEATETGSQPTAEIAFGKSKNFLCKLSDKVDKTCQLKEIEFNDSTKKWANFTDLKKADKSATITKSTLSNADKFYLATVSDELASKINWSTGADKLTIETNTTATTQNKYASLKPLLAFKKKSIKAKHNLYLVKAAETFPASGTSGVTVNSSSNDYKCVLKESDISTESKHKACTIKQFAATQSNASESSNYSSLTYTNNTTNPTTITKHNFYLVQFTNDLTPEELKDLSIFYVAKQSTTWTKTITFKPIRQAIQTGATGSEKLIILA